MPDAKDQRRKVIERRILHTVLSYFQAHGEPIRMQILAAKFGKALVDLGGFPELMQELEGQGELRIEIAKSGAQLVYPKIESTEQKKVWF